MGEDVEKHPELPSENPIDAKLTQLLRAMEQLQQTADELLKAQKIGNESFDHAKNLLAKTHDVQEETKGKMQHIDDTLTVISDSGVDSAPAMRARTEALTAGPPRVTSKTIAPEAETRRPTRSWIDDARLALMIAGAFVLAQALLSMLR